MSPFVREHIDANTMAALIEQGLSGDEEAAVFTHLAGCAPCREWLALNIAQSDRPFSKVSRPMCHYAAVLAASLVMALSIVAWNATHVKPVPARQPVYREMRLIEAISLDSSFAAAGHAEARLPTAWVHAKLLQNPDFTPAHAHDESSSTRHIVLMTALGERWISIKSKSYLQ